MFTLITLILNHDTIMNKQRIAIGIEYDGSRFSGWQMQAHGTRTVQELVQLALSKIANHAVMVTCAGRTDTGVHATSQIVHFDTTAIREDKAWVLGVNTELPDDVAIVWGCRVPDDFNARFKAIKRSYRYVIRNSRTRPAILNHRVTWIYDELDIQAMQNSAQALLGDHDFSSFRSSQCQAKHARRVMKSITVTKDKEHIYIDITANAFLHHMVRNIVGSLLLVGRGEKTVEWIGELLELKDRTQAGPTASASGLYLVEVEYPSEYGLRAKGWLPHYG